MEIGSAPKETTVSSSTSGIVVIGFCEEVASESAAGRGVVVKRDDSKVGGDSTSALGEPWRLLVTGEVDTALWYMLLATEVAGDIGRGGRAAID